jgi:cytochrome c peroxidase
MSLGPRSSPDTAIVPSTRGRLGLVLAAAVALMLASCGADRALPTSPVEPTPTAPPPPATPASVTGPLTINFVNGANYAAPILPAYYDGAVARLDNAPGGGAINDRVATLGRVLFYDKRLSINDTISCASCHQQALGFSDPRPFSVGFSGASTPAHSTRLGNVRYYGPGTMFWNKRAASLEAQASQPILSAIEMGFTPADGGVNALITKMDGIAYYPDLFRFAFGSSLITEERFQQALAQFQRAMISSASRWDVAYAQVYTPVGDRNINVDLPGLTAQENRGRALFMGDAGAGVTCAACHVPPTFALDANAGGIGLDPGESTVFKAPSLKNVGLGGPYMHDGRFATLDQVVDHYDGGVRVGPALDSRLRNGNGGARSFNLSSAEKAALVAFLRTLDDPSLTNDPRFSNPFR